MTMPELPHIQGLPSYHNVEYWDPFFRAVSEEQVVMCLHIGQGFAAINNAPGRTDRQPDHPGHPGLGVGRSGPAVGTGLQGTTPTSRWRWSEAGIGWIPFYLNRCDRHYTQPALARPRLRRQAARPTSSGSTRLACYVTDPTALKVRHDIGVDIIAWECDYPHSDSIFPGAPEFVHAELIGAGCDDEEINKITWENSCSVLPVGAVRPHLRGNPADGGSATPSVAGRRHDDPVEARVARLYDTAMAGR